MAANIFDPAKGILQTFLIGVGEAPEEVVLLVAGSDFVLQTVYAGLVWAAVGAAF